MNFEPQWYQLSFQQANEVLLVLDTARPVKGQDKVENLAATLLERLPRSVSVQIALLGSSQIYSQAQAKSHWQTLWPQSQGRLRTLTPVLRSLEQQKITPQIIILGNGSIHDAADFKAEPLLKNARFVRCSAASLTHDMWAEQEPQLESLASQIDNPLTGVEILCTSHLPLSWPSTFEWEGGHLTSKSTSFTDSGSLNFCFVGTKTQNLTAKMLHRDGTERHRSLDLCPEPEETSRWQHFSPEESKIVAQCREQQKYHCSLCGKIHPASQLICEGGRGLGTPVLSSVPSKTSLILVRANDSGFEWRPVEMQGYPVADGAFITAGKAQGFYQLEENAWRQVSTARPMFQPLKGGDSYLVRL